MVRMERYLGDWKTLPICEVKKRIARQKHAKLSTKHAKRIANMAMKDLRYGSRR
jgi:hypothetical protein